MTQALDDIRILDLTGGIAGPLGVLQLAEHGADVIKVEPPGGLPDRAQPSSVAYNRSRRSVTIDFREPEGIAALRTLLATADVLVEAFSPGTMASFGLDYESLRDDFPGLVYCSVPAWPSGSRFEDLPGYEAIVHARTGQQWEITSFRSGPVFLHSPVASLAASFLVPIGIMSALHARRSTARGQRVEVSLLQGVMSLTTQFWNWTEKGQFGLDKTIPPGVHQLALVECADGEWLHTSVMNGMTATRSEASILGIEELDMTALFSMSPADRAVYDAERRAAFKRRSRAELIMEMQDAGLGCEPVFAPHERFDHPHLLATGSPVVVDDPEVGRTTQIGQTIFLRSTPGEVTGPQPRAGAHNDEILGGRG